jgi:hypothetical protein
MLAVNGATSRCIQAIDALVQTHNSVINLGLPSGIIVPSNIDFGEFLLYLPVVAALFSDGVTSRTTLYSPTSLKDGKGVVGSLKSFMGMQFSPIEPLNPSFVEFSESIAKNPKTRDIFSACSKAYNLLQDPQTRALIHSGMAKMQTQGWIKEKETAEFRRSMGENFAAITSQSTPVDTRYVASNRVEEAATGTAQTVRFVTYQGLERQVRIDELESLRKEDADQFNKQNPSVDYSAGYSTEIRDFLTTLRIPHNKQYCIEHSEDWVQNQLYALLANSQFQTNLHREQTFNVGDLEARIDFDVDGVGIEVKIFRGMQDFDRLTREMLVYGKEYSEILIPYINAGGLSNEQLETALSLLSEHYPQVKGHFALNCADLF